jgi:hypothetical protein
MKFRKRISVLPGLTLNLSRSGISTTVGVRGASVNMNRQGAFLNTGIPGTGLYDRKKISGGSQGTMSARKASAQKGAYNSGRFEVSPSVQAAQINLSKFTSTEFKELDDDVQSCYEERAQLFQQLLLQHKKWRWAKGLNTLSKILIFGWFTDGPQRWMEKQEERYSELMQEYEACKIELGMEGEQEILRAFESLKQAFMNLSQCAAIWDLSHNTTLVSHSFSADDVANINRIPVKLSVSTMDTLRADTGALKFENADGGDFYLYPPLLVMAHSIRNFALIGYSDLKLSWDEYQFLETGHVPHDTEILHFVWFRANKDGSPDRRFRDNFQIPVCRYGKLTFEGKNGLKEIYLFSNLARSYAFFQAFTHYRTLLIGLGKSS